MAARALLPTVMGYPDGARPISVTASSSVTATGSARFDDGHTSLVFPGPDAIIEHPRRKVRRGRRRADPGRCGFQVLFQGRLYRLSGCGDDPPGVVNGRVPSTKMPVLIASDA